MSQRTYRMGRRQSGVDRTRSAILAAARELVIELGAELGLGKVAERAGVSRSVAMMAKSSTLARYSRKM